MDSFYRLKIAGGFHLKSRIPGLRRSGEVHEENNTVILLDGYSKGESSSESFDVRNR
jgi:hypothetical protein